MLTNQAAIETVGVTEGQKHANNIVITAYQLWNLQACFPRDIQVE